MDVVDADVSLAAFHAADVGAVEPRAMGEVLLTKSEGQPVLTDSLAEGDAALELLPSRGGHLSTVGRCGL